jgi:hypothetical protein
MGNGSLFAIGAFVGFFVGSFWAWFWLLTSDVGWFVGVVLGSVLFCGFMTMRYEEKFLEFLAFFS